MRKWLLLVVVLGCDDGAAAAPDARPADPVDGALADVADARRPVDASADAAPPDAALPSAPAALLLDFELRPASSWRLLFELADGVERPLSYRRFWPHAHDLRPESLVIVAAGGAPGRPVPHLTGDDADRLVDHVQAGGDLVLLTQNGWADGLRSLHDRFWFDRVLARLQIDVRVEPNTLIGEVALPMDPKPPLHTTHPWGYPGPLEWTLDLPVGFPATEVAGFAGMGPFAAGWTAGLACDGPRAAVLARSHADVYRWHRLGGDDDRVTLPGEAQPLVILAQAPHGGHVLVAPRTLFELPTHSVYGGDQPILELSLLAGTEALAAAALRALLDPPRLAGCAGGPRPLAAPIADGLDPVADGPERRLPVAPRRQAPPMPAGDLHAVYQGRVAPESPDWFPDHPLRLGYAEVLSPDQVAQLRDVGLDGVVVRLNASDYLTPGDATRAAVADTASLADGGVHPWLSVHYRHGGWGEMAAAVGPTRGPYGRVLDAPPPTAARWWDEGVTPLFAGARGFAAAGISGFLLDIELYGAGAPMYALGDLADDRTWGFLSDTMDLPVVPVAGRFHWLLEQGRLAEAVTRLEAHIAERAAAARVAAGPLRLGVYMPYLGDDWFTRGLLRGLGTPDQPVIVLSYDHAGGPLAQAWAGEGIHTQVIGGVLGLLFAPADLGAALRNASARSHGSWFFTVSDLVRDDAAARLHAPPAAYFEVMRGLDE